MEGYLRRCTASFLALGPVDLILGWSSAPTAA